MEKETMLAETASSKETIYDGIIINHEQRTLFFAYLGIKLKLPKIIAESTVLTTIVALILILGAPTAMMTVSVGGLLGVFGVTTTVFSLGTFTPFILTAAGVLVAGVAGIAVTNLPKLSFKSAQNVILEELSKYLFLPALVLVKQNAANFDRDEKSLIEKIKKQMTDIGYTSEYVNFFFGKYENMDAAALEDVLAKLNTSSDKLKKKMPGTGKLYSSDFKPVLYVDKAIVLCNEISDKYCDEVAKQNENKKTISHLKALLSADKPTFLMKTREKVLDVQKAFVNKHLFTKQEAQKYADALFIEPFVWFLRSPNMKAYCKQILTRKMDNLGYDENAIKETLAVYDEKTPEDILQSVKERYGFSRSNGVKTDVLTKFVVYHCEKECYIYCDNPKGKEPTEEEKLLAMLKACMQGKEEPKH